MFDIQAAGSWVLKPHFSGSRLTPSAHGVLAGCLHCPLVCGFVQVTNLTNTGKDGLEEGDCILSLVLYNVVGLQAAG